MTDTHLLTLSRELDALLELTCRYLNSLDTLPFSFTRDEEEQNRLLARYHAFALRVAKHLSALDEAMLPVSHQVLQADAKRDNDTLAGAIRHLDTYTAFRHSLVTVLDEIEANETITPSYLLTEARRIAELTRNAKVTLCE